MYAAPADVPMQELDASPGVPPGMQIEPPPVPPMEGPPPGMPAPPPGLSGPYMVAAPDQAVREFKAPPAAHDPTRHVSRDRRREQVLEQSKGLRAAALQARRDTGDARSAQENVAAHRRMGLRTINQQPSYKPLGPIAGINRPVDEPEIPEARRVMPGVSGGTIRIPAGTDPRQRNYDEPAFGPVKKPKRPDIGAPYKPYDPKKPDDDWSGGWGEWQGYVPPIKPPKKPPLPPPPSPPLKLTP